MSDMPLLTRYQVKKILTRALKRGTYLDDLKISDDYNALVTINADYDFLYPEDHDKIENLSVYDDMYGNQNKSLRDELFG